MDLCSVSICVSLVVRAVECLSICCWDVCLDGRPGWAQWPALSSALICTPSMCGCGPVTVVMFSVPSTKKDRAPREMPRDVWLRITGLGAGLVLAALLLWSSLGAEDAVAEVLAHRGEVLAGRFVEVPCSEDYDGHRRFEGALPLAARGSESRRPLRTAVRLCWTMVAQAASCRAASDRPSGSAGPA